MRRLKLSRRFLCIPLPPKQVCHGYAVGSSADISTASAFPTVFVFVFLLYQKFPANGEELMNIPGKIYCQIMQYIQKPLSKDSGFILCRIHIGNPQKHRNHQGKHTDEPGIHSFSGENRQRKAAASE